MGVARREQVIIVATTYTGKTGTIKNVNGHLLEVDLANGEGLVSLSWNDVQKEHPISSFIQVSHGPNQGQSGWVVRIEDGLLHCIKELPIRLQNSHSLFLDEIAERKETITSLVEGAETGLHLQVRVNIIFSSHKRRPDTCFP